MIAIDLILILMVITVIAGPLRFSVTEFKGYNDLLRISFGLRRGSN